MATLRNRPPIWFWVVAVLITLWATTGIAAFYTDVTMTPAELAQLPAYDRALLAGRPAWYVWLYGAAVWSGLIGGVLLLLRLASAQVVFAVSLIAVIVMFGYIFATTDLIAVKGFAVAAGLPILIAVIAAFQLWFAGYARRRGWIV